MKSMSKNIYLTIMAAGLGAIGTGLRGILYTIGFDDKGLLPADHPLNLACWLLAVCTAVYLLLAVRKLEDSDDYGENFPGSGLRALGNLVAAGALILSGLDLGGRVGDNMDMAWAVMSFCAAGCMVILTYFNLRGKKPPFVLHAVICVYFAMDLVCRYRSWSGNPQLQDYGFHLLACVFLTLTAYYRLAFDVGLGRRRLHTFSSLMAAFFCLVAMPAPENWQFWLGGAIWAVSDLCRLGRVRRSGGESQEGD